MRLFPCANLMVLGIFQTNSRVLHYLFWNDGMDKIKWLFQSLEKNPEMILISLCGFQYMTAKTKQEIWCREPSECQTKLNYTCNVGSECCVLIRLSNWDNQLNRGNLTLLPSHQIITIGVKTGTRQRGCLLHFTELLVMPIMHDIINLFAGYLQLHLIKCHWYSCAGQG